MKRFSGLGFAAQRRCRFAAASLAAACLLGVSACSAPASGHAGGQPKPETAERVDSPITVETTEDLGQDAAPPPIPGIASHAISQRGEGQNTLVRYPSVTGYEPFNQHALVSTQKYVDAAADGEQADGQVAELRGSWQLLAASGPVVGVRSVVTGGASVTSGGGNEVHDLILGKGPGGSECQVTTLWATGPEQTPVTGVELIAQQQREHLLDLIGRAVENAGYRVHFPVPAVVRGAEGPGGGPHGSVEDDAAAVETSEQAVLRAVSFTPEGALRVWLPAGLIASPDAGDLLVTISAQNADKYLSEIGRAAQAASGPEAPPFAALGPATPRQGHVDCAVAKCVALTFDDGPGDYTAGLLDTLWGRGVPATFFLIGNSAERQPELVRRMLAEGSEVGNHTRSHPQLSKLNANGQRDQVEGGAGQIQAASGYRPTLLRPPYGDLNATTRQLGWPLILWDVDTLDWKTKDTNATINSAVNDAQPGSIILMHDVHAPSVAAVPAIIDELQARGYTLVTVSDLYGGALQPGAKYFNQHKVH